LPFFQDFCQLSESPSIALLELRSSDEDKDEPLRERRTLLKAGDKGDKEGRGEKDTV